MSFAALTRLQQGLAALKADHLERRRLLLDGAQGAHVTINGQRVVSFCSNDYLGLAADPALVAAAHAALDQCGVGAGAAHLITGHHRFHHDFEAAFARFVGKPAALLFSTGYMANLGVLTTLAARKGEVFGDKLNHASLVDAAQLSGASFTRYRHNDLAQLEGQLAASTAQDKIIASDLVFSMDGDTAPVDALLDLAERFDAWLYLDDAHGFGVLNDGRGGLTDRARASDRVIYLATLGKAAGVAGAAVAAHASVIDWLIQKARPYIYTTASPPLLAACLLESLRQIEAGAARRERLRSHIAAAARGAGRLEARLADGLKYADPAARDRRQRRRGAVVASLAAARSAGGRDPHADGARQHSAAAHHPVGGAQRGRCHAAGRGPACPRLNPSSRWCTAGA